jgi:molecular chaperone GrpE
MTDKKQPPVDNEGPHIEGKEESAPAETAGDEVEIEERAPDLDADALVHEIELEHEELKNVRAKLKKREGELRQLRKEKDELRDQLLRRLADMDNLKKRLERERDDYYQYALMDFLKDLLPVLDNLERALGHPDESDGKNFQEGVRLIHKQFLDAIRKRGVSPITDVVGHKFDPNREQALATEESEEAEEPVVAEELQRGYTLNDRLIRPALVKVRMPKKAKT